MTTPDGFDVSKWQPPTNWDWSAVDDLNAELKATKGRSLIFVARASYGARLLDKRFAKYAELARKHGLLFGAYHFYRQVHSVEDQMRVWEKAMEQIDDLQPGELYPVLDMEDNAINGDGRVNKRLWNRACDEIGDAWAMRYGGCILYYSSFFPDMLDAYKKDAEWEWMQEEGYFHWLADYSSEPGYPRTPYTDEWHLHQARPRVVPMYRGGPVDANFAPSDLDVQELLIPEGICKPKDSGSPEVHLEDDPLEDIYEGGG
jgi:lysozyme